MKRYRHKSIKRRLKSSESTAPCSVRTKTKGETGKLMSNVKVEHFVIQRLFLLQPEPRPCTDHVCCVSMSLATHRSSVLATIRGITIVAIDCCLSALIVLVSCVCVCVCIHTGLQESEKSLLSLLFLSWVVFEEPGFCGESYVIERGLYGCPEDWGALQPRIASAMPVVLVRVAFSVRAA